MSFPDKKTTAAFAASRNKNQSLYFFIFTLVHLLHHVWLTYADLFSDSERKKDISDFDLYGHTLCDIMVIIYALLSIKFTSLKNFFMMVFFFFLCLQYAIVANIERVSYEEVRIHFAEIFIYFFSIVQLFTSAYWLTELIVCNIILLVTCYGMLYHMYHP